VRNIEHCMGSLGRPSAADLFDSVFKVTCPESLFDFAQEVVEDDDAASQATEQSYSASASDSAPDPAVAEEASRLPRKLPGLLEPSD
jgi:hypothetical protein